jgi:hypothetical protein
MNSSLLNSYIFFNPIVDPSRCNCVQSNEKKNKKKGNLTTKTYTHFFLSVSSHDKSLYFLFLYLHITFACCPQTFIDIAKIQCASWWRKKKCVVMCLHITKDKKATEKEKEKGIREPFLSHFLCTHLNHVDSGETFVITSFFSSYN